jgi:tetratricopeptide (TPR) repeat protein
MGVKAAGERKTAEAANLNRIGRDALHGDDFPACLNHAHYVIYLLKDGKSPRQVALLMDAWLNLVSGYMGLKEYAMAIVYGLEMLKQYESDARMHFIVGLAFQKLGAFLKAEEYLLKSITLGEENQAAKKWLCFARMGLGKVEESTHLLHQLEESPDLLDTVERCLSHRLKAGYLDGFGDEVAYWIDRYPGHQKFIELQALHESQKSTLVEPEPIIDDDMFLEKKD